MHTRTDLYGYIHENSYTNTATYMHELTKIDTTHIHKYTHIGIYLILVYSKTKCGFALYLIYICNFSV